ncbi:MAG: peptidylprolyl isomerase [Firmicutes bacterium]|nr:peptidylprolyl isomerase [Bacillota bacterium]
MDVRESGTGGALPAGGPAPRRALWAVALGGAALAVLAAAVVLALGVRRPEVVATVNGEAITKDELYQRMLQQGGAQVLDRMITEKLIDQAAKKAGVTVSSADVDKEIARIRAQFGSDAEFQQALAMNGMTEDDLRSSARLNLEIRGVLAPTIQVSDADLQAFFQANHERYDQPEEIRARHILVDSQEKAAELRAQLDKGASFADLAKQYSLDPSTKDQGGELGWFSRGKMTAAFEDAAFALQPGQVSDPVQTEYGWHLILLEERKPAMPAKFADVRDRVRADYIDDQVAQASGDWLAKLRAEASIVNRLSAVGALSR